MIYSLVDYHGPHDTFNISSGEGKSQNEIMELLKEQGYKFTVNYKKARNVDVKKIILDNSKICSVYKKDLIPFEKGLQMYCDYLTSN